MSHSSMPRVLVFSTNTISDPGIDLAGSRHLHYSPGVVVISVPCASGIKPSWIVHALTHGFDGVFIAADGDECAYLSDCSRRSAGIAEQAQAQLKEHGIPANRVRMAAVCSVCAEPFTKQVTEFVEEISEAVV